MAKVLNRVLGGRGSGGASANIYVTGLSQTDTCTMTTPSGKVVNGVWGAFPTSSDPSVTTNGYTFHANEYGIHTITATNGTKTSTEEVLVDALMDYYVEMGKWWIPIGYTKLNWIKSTGTQHIDTGMAASNDTYIIDVEDARLTYNTNNGLFGSSSFLYSLCSYGSKFMYCLSSYRFETLAGQTASQDDFVTGRFTCNANGVTDDYGRIFSRVSDSNSGGGNIYIFSGGRARDKTDMKFKEWIRIRNGNKIQHIVPVKTPTGEIGTYECVSERYIGNSGSGVFIGG